MAEETRPTFAVFDIDGVLADHRHRLGHLRGKKDWNKFFAASEKDSLSPRGAALLEEYQEQCEVVLFTGRPVKERDRTRRWLQRHGLGELRLEMRRDGDRSPSPQMKGKILRRLLEEGDVLVVVDDELAAVQTAEGLGLPTIHATWVRKR